MSSYLETRKCSGNGCTGPIKRYSSCNTQKCPRGSEDFRSMQCSKFNTVPFERKLYEWIPYLKAPRKCELNCMPKGERFYYRHNKTVSTNTKNNMAFSMLSIDYKFSTFDCEIYSWNHFSQWFNTIAFWVALQRIRPLWFWALPLKSYPWMV